MKRIAVLLMLFLFSFPYSNSQTQNNIGKSEKPLISYESINNWFFGIGSGVMYHLSVNVLEENPFTMMAPAFQVFAGKYFSPVWGARLSASYSRVKGRTTEEMTDAYHDIFEDGRYKFSSLGLWADGLLSLNNLIKPNGKSRWNVSAILGIGMNRSFNFSKNTDKWNWEQDGHNYRYMISSNPPFLFAARCGLQVDYKLSSSFGLTIEPIATITNDRWNRVSSGTCEAYATLQLGLVYNFKNRAKRIYNFSSIVHTGECDSIISNYIISKNRNIDTATSAIDILDTRISFEPKSFRIADNQYGNLEDVIRYLKNNDDKRIVIVGFGDTMADKKSSKSDNKLAYKRASEVYELLKSAPGIMPDRMIISFFDKIDGIGYNSKNIHHVIFIIKSNK